MPEPLTFSRSKSPSLRSQARVTARTWAANASFSSMRSMSASVRPARPSALATAGPAADAHRGGCDAGHAPAHEPGQRAQAKLGGLLRAGDQARGGRVVLAAGVAGGNGGLRVQAQPNWLELAEDLDAGVGARVLVGLEDGLRFCTFRRDRDG